MGPFINHFVSGRAFFSGVALILGGMLASMLSKNRLACVMALIIGICGLITVALSATPFPVWLYICCAVVLLTYTVVHSVRSVRYRRMYDTLTVVFICTTVFWQLSYYQMPELPERYDNKFYLVGDSISAGIGNNEIVRWPQIIRERHSVDSVDFSSPGATVQSSLNRAAKIPVDDHLVLLEIGGNDVLGKTPLAEFESSLSALLRTLCYGRRVIVMLEIPLPPFCNGYGLIQRRLARQFGVVLIPRRFFADVLATNQATVDGLHLSQQGHEAMASMVWEFLRPALEGLRL